MVAHQHLPVLQGGRFARHQFEIAERCLSCWAIVEKKLGVGWQVCVRLKSQSVES